jgi:hypothetical protein
MPWKACKPMDERLKFIARLLDGEKIAGSAGNSASHARPATRSSRATTILVWKGSPIARADRTATPPAAHPGRGADRPLQAGQAELGSPENQGKTGSALSGCAHAGKQYGACRARSSRPGQALGVGSGISPTETPRQRYRILEYWSVPAALYSRGCLVFLVGPARHDLQSVIWQGSLQGLGFIPGRATF